MPVKPKCSICGAGDRPVRHNGFVYTCESCQVIIRQIREPDVAEPRDLLHIRIPRIPRGSDFPGILFYETGHVLDDVDETEH